jgi:N-acetylmuramoyl-L-alanine amidase
VEPVAPVIIDRPITWDAERERLTLEYLREHSDPDVQSTDITPRVIVLHWTAVDSLEASFATFDPPKLAGRPELQQAGALNVSAHFLVDRDGTIYRLMPETKAARHCIGLNHVSIGVENVGGGPEAPLTDAQVEANAQLVRWLDGKHDIDVLIGHSEYRSLEGTEYFRERDPDYRTEKPDPGADFLKAVRERVADLHLR